MNYNDALNKLDTPRKKDSKKLENNTYLIRHENYIGVKLHDTEVVKLYPKHVKLYTGGWFTATTKDRINKYAPVQIKQVNHIWYIGTNLFQEGVKVDYNGKVLSKTKSAKDNEKANAKIKKDIKSFVDYATKEVGKGIDLPSNGDCWHCVLTTQEGKTWGDTDGDHDLLKQHIEEKYVVPALVWNAVKERGYTYPEIIIGYDHETKKSGHHFVEWSVKNALRRYLTTRLLVR